MQQMQCDHGKVSAMLLIPGVGVKADSCKAVPVTALCQVCGGISNMNSVMLPFLKHAMLSLFWLCSTWQHYLINISIPGDIIISLQNKVCKSKCLLNLKNGQLIADRNTTGSSCACGRPHCRLGYCAFTCKDRMPSEAWGTGK